MDTNELRGTDQGVSDSSTDASTDQDVCSTPVATTNSSAGILGELDDENCPDGADCHVDQHGDQSHSDQGPAHDSQNNEECEPRTRHQAVQPDASITGVNQEPEQADDSTLLPIYTSMIQDMDLDWEVADVFNT